MSLLVDGFRAAAKLKSKAPDLYDVLTRVGIPCHASGNEGITIAPDQLYPVIQRSPGREVPHRIRWNPADWGVIPAGRKTPHMQWYKAAKLWNEILRKKSMEYQFQLEPGTLLSK